VDPRRHVPRTDAVLAGPRLVAARELLGGTLVNAAVTHAQDLARPGDETITVSGGYLRGAAAQAAPAAGLPAPDRQGITRRLPDDRRMIREARGRPDENGER
jgi:Selenocysteine synthase N terminal